LELADYAVKSATIREHDGTGWYQSIPILDGANPAHI
jgi:hypothetical protein